MPPRFAPARPAHGRVQPNGAGTINGSGSSSASVYGVRQPHRPGTRRASTQGGDGGPLADPVPIEEFPPPEWRTVLNSRADLGYPDLYPSRPGFGQPEDDMSEAFVKTGFSVKPAVAVTAETFSMHGPVYQQLQTGGLQKLMELGKQIILERDKAMPSFSERAFRIPVRVTYNDTKRLQFLADLGNPDIPLTRLMRNPVPHGFKGVELLDTMFAPPQPAARVGAPAASAPRSTPIPIDRALWFIRVLGANEISAHRGRAQPAASSVQARSPVAATPSSTATFVPSVAPLNSNDWYTAEFTQSFIAWLRVQLGQLVLPTKPKAGAPKAPAGVLGDDKSRARWLVKWQYSNALLLRLSRKQLLSRRVFVGWLADFLSSANFAQLGFVTQLMHEHLVDLTEFVGVGRVCVRAACAKIEEIRASPAKETLQQVEQQLANLVRVLYNADHEVLVSPATWSRHSALLATLVDSTGDDFVELGRRNEALIFRPTVVIDSGSSPRRQQMAEIQKLDSIAAETDMTALCKAFFSGPCAPTSPRIDADKLEEKVFILVNWAMGLYQLGIHRPYAVYTMLKKWLEWFEDARPHEHFDFFPILYKWLDTSPAAHSSNNVLAIGISFGELTRQGLFSYGRYLNTLIARGHSARFGGPPSHHLELLRAMPIFVEARDLLEQRRLVLSGDGEARERDQADEDAALETYRQELKEYVPEIFGMRRYHRSALVAESIDYQIPSAASLSRFEFVQTRFWFSAAAVHTFRRQGKQPPMNPSTFARVMNICMQCRGYSTLADYLVRAITGTDDEEILLIILDSIKRDADVWTSIDRWNQITTALMDRFRILQRQRRFVPQLAAVLLMLAAHGRLPSAAQEEVRAATDQHRCKSPPMPAFEVDIEQSMKALTQIIHAGAAERATVLAPKLFTRHGKFENWAEVWWTTVVKAVHTAETAKSANAVAAAVAHVGQVDNQAGDGTLRPVGAKWVEGLTASQRVDIFGRRHVPPIVSLLLSLIIQRRLGSFVLLEKLVFPELKHAAGLCTAPNARLSSKRTCAIDWTVALTQRLLLCTGHKSLPPQNLREAFVVQTARAAVFHASNVESLILHLPVLVVLERSRIVPEKTRVQIKEIFRGLATLPQFKTAAFRNLDVLKDAFLSNDWIKHSNDTALETGMVEGLKLMMSDSVQGVKSSSLPTIETNTRYSAWRWTRVVLEMRVEFKNLTMRITNNNDPVEARQLLSRLVRSSLDREASPDDMDLLVEAFRGADTVVAQEILTVGLDRLAGLLSQVLSAEDQHQVEAIAVSVDLVLRVIGSVGRQDKTEAATAAARDRLLNLLLITFQSVERRVTSEEDLQPLPGAAKLAEPGDILKVALKLLRFALALPPAEGNVPAQPAMPKPDYALLTTAFLHLSVALCGRSPVHTDLDTMRDVLIYLVDSVPAASLSAVYHALAYETTTQPVQDLLARHPSFASALPRPSTTSRTTALVGSQVMGESVALDDRPWEMLEHMTVQVLPKHQDLFLASKPLKDTSSIPIALFKPQLTRDAVPTSEEDTPAWDHASSERTLGNGFAGEPVSARQAATVLYARLDGAERERELEADREQRERERELEAQDRERERELSVPIPLSVAGSAPVTPTKSVASGVSTSRRSSGRVHKGTGTGADPIALVSDSSDEDEEPLAKRARTSKNATSTRTNAGGKVPRKTAATGAGATGKKAPAKAPAKKAANGKDKSRRKS